MNIDTSILNDFARAVKSNEKESDVTILGRVVRIDDPQHAVVELDGSSARTLARFGCVARAGDRVAVLIKDHKAIITSNLSAPPSASSDSDYIKVQPDGSILIGRFDEEGHLIGFHVEATSNEYHIRDASGNVILNITQAGGELKGSDILTMADIDLLIKSYMDLEDKPSIEGVTLEGNKTFAELNLDVLSNAEIEYGIQWD